MQWDRTSEFNTGTYSQINDPPGCESFPLKTGLPPVQVPLERGFIVYCGKLS